jgi:hypothetical protein
MFWHGNGINGARLQSFVGGLLRARNDPLCAFGEADQARQADRAAITRKKPKMYFWNPNLRSVDMTR